MAALSLPTPNVSITRADAGAGESEKDKKEAYHPPSLNEVNSFIQTYKLAEIDKEFEPPDSSADPYPQSDNCILIWQAALNALSVLAFLAGPEGIVASAGLVFVSSTISAVPSSNQGALDTLKGIEELIEGKLLDHELDKRVAHVTSYIKFIDQHRDLFDSLELDTTGDRPVYSHHSTFENNLETLKDSILPTLLEFSRPGVNGLYDRLADLGESGRKPEWNCSDIRAVGIMIDTILLITMKYLALFYARYAAYALQKGDEKEATTHITSYYNQMDTMRKTIDDRLKLIKGNVDRLRAWRLARVTEVKDEDHSRSVLLDVVMDSSDPEPHAFSYWVDEYTKKDEHRKNATGPKGFFSKEWDYGQSHSDATTERDDYVTRLRAHIGRVLHPDEMVQQAWTATMKAASRFLCPPDPIITILKNGLQHVERPHAWLHDATFVQFAYQVENDHGTSERSPWSKENAYDGHNLPVVELQSGYKGEVTWIVWHRKKLVNGEEQEAIAAKVHGSHSLEWVDEHHDNPGGR